MVRLGHDWDPSWVVWPPLTVIWFVFGSIRVSLGPPLVLLGPPGFVGFTLDSILRASVAQELRPRTTSASTQVKTARFKGWVAHVPPPVANGGGLLLWRCCGCAAALGLCLFSSARSGLVCAWGVRLPGRCVRAGFWLALLCGGSRKNWSLLRRVFWSRFVYL